MVTGLALPSVGACIRARWSHVLADPPLVQTAYALESVVDEAVFMLGPILVTVLATTWHPVAGLTVAIATGVGGTLFLAAQRATQPPPHARSTTVADRPRIPWRVVAPLAVVALALGALFGSAEVTTVAFSEEHGAKGFTGVLLALWALGSLLAGVITGAIRWRRDTGYRLRVSTFALTCGMAPLALLDSMWLMGAFLFLAGFAIAPSLIATLSMIEQSRAGGPADRGDVDHPHRPRGRHRTWRGPQWPRHRRGRRVAGVPGVRGSGARRVGGRADPAAPTPQGWQQCPGARLETVVRPAGARRRGTRVAGCRWRRLGARSSRVERERDSQWCISPSRV